MLKQIEIQPYYNQPTYTSCEPAGHGTLPPPSTVIAHLTNGEPPPSSLSPHRKRLKRSLLPSVDDDVENVGNGHGGTTGNEHDSSATAATGHPGDSYYGKSPSSQSHSMIGVGPPSWGVQQPVTADHPPPPPPPHPSLDPTRWRHPPFIGADTHHTMAAPPHLMWEGGWQPPY